MQNNIIKHFVIKLILLFFLISGSLTVFSQEQSKQDSLIKSKVNDTTKSVTQSQKADKDTVVKPNPVSSTVRIGYEVVDGDTIPVYLYRDYLVERKMTHDEEFRYKKLVRDIKKALPYAKLAAFRLQMMEDNLSLLKKESTRKKYIKECEKAIKKEFMDDLKDLTITQGKILLKLIHRETGKTTWEILNSYQGKLETVFWQSMAKMYGATTKDTYDPIVDYEIERIIKQLELE